MERLIMNAKSVINRLGLWRRTHPRAAQRLLLGVRVIVPISILACIATSVDLPTTWQYLQSTDPRYFLLALVVGFMLQLPSGAYRWRVYLTSAFGISIPRAILLKQYWIGMFLGYFMPGNIGWDAYRVCTVQTKSPGILKHTCCIVLEKVFGICVCFCLALIAWPFVANRCNSPLANQIADVIFPVMAIAILLAAFAFCLKRILFGLLRVLEKRILAMANGLLPRNHVQTRNQGPPTIRKTLEAAFRMRPLALMCLGTVVIRTCAVFGGYWILLSIDQDVSIFVPLFVIPMTGIVFLLPISFGSIGVREGTFIVLYGMFGIAREAALAASVLGLLALSITVAIGGLIMLLSSITSATDKGDATNSDGM